MSPTRIVALLLIIAGVLGIAYGSFTYTRETHKAAVGPIELSLKDTQTVNVPLWASVAALVAGAGLLVFGGKPR
jgi:TRAP-type C4-dicarboxylate transport system permease small subunit